MATRVEGGHGLTDHPSCCLDELMMLFWRLRHEKRWPEDALAVVMWSRLVSEPHYSPRSRHPKVLSRQDQPLNVQSPQALSGHLEIRYLGPGPSGMGSKMT